MASKAGIEGGFRIVGQGDDEGDPTSDSADPRPSITLDDLRRMSTRDLGRLYRDAEPPTELKGLDGSLTGALLTLTGPLSRGLPRAITNRIASSHRFPWAGKTFQSWAEDRGSGVNRVNLLGERLWCHFETRIEPSVHDREPCIVLDYGHADNPWLIRQVRDEMRQVATGLWFGPGNVGGLLVLYFAVQAP